MFGSMRPVVSYQKKHLAEAGSLGLQREAKKNKKKQKLCELLHGLWQQAVRESGSLSGGLQCERTWRICQEAANTPVGVRLVSGRTSVRYRFGSPFFSKRLWFVDTVL